MNPYRYILRSLQHYRGAHLWIVLGSLICTAILVGALIVGDSVQYSLQQMVLDRLGRTQFALSSGDRFFRQALADELADRLETVVAPILQARGMAVAGDGQQRVNRISVVGVDGRFGKVGDGQAIYDQLSAKEVVVNRALASQLRLEVGDRLLLRLEALNALPGDAPLASAESPTAASRFTVRDIVGPEAFGSFRLHSNQIAPGTAFVSLSALARELDLPGRANGLLVAQREGAPLSSREVDAALQTSWTLADAGLEWHAIAEGQGAELRSGRIFIDHAVLDAAERSGLGTQPILTYFVNEIVRGDQYTPYSFVSAPGTPVVPNDMQDDEIIINQWVAEDLGAATGDRIHLRYFVLERMGELTEITSEFRVRDVVPLSGAYADRGLLPDFPGLTDEVHCRDWEAGIPVDYERIRKKDEDYWTEFRGTPKAFVTLNTAQRMWQNRFGDVTAIRFQGESKERVEPALKEGLSPDLFGLTFRDVRSEGLRSSEQSVDFSQLFLGLSFFVILASLLLTGLLFAFHTQNRSRETGILLAVGFGPGEARRMLLLEGALVACVGSVLGGAAGVGVNHAILLALGTVWGGAVGATSLQMHLRPLTVLMGIGIGTLLSTGAVWLTVRRQVREPIASLQRGLGRIATSPCRLPRTSIAVAPLCLAAALLLPFLIPDGEGQATLGIYFAAGTMVLVGGIALVSLLISYSRRAFSFQGLSPLGLGIHGLGRRRLRSLTVLGLLACGLFLVFTVGANRKSAIVDANRRESGTGGFTLYGHSTVPVLHDLNRPDVRRDYGLDSPALDRARFVQLRVKEGDDASCLNLNRVSNPQLLGVDPKELADRNAFTFSQVLPEMDSDNPWLLLSKPAGGGPIPAVADLAVIHWGLGKAVGDTLLYTDERGRTFGVRLIAGLANSVFQGNLIVSEEHLVEKYPTLSGYRLFLIDSPLDSAEDISRRITWALQDRGIEVVKTSDRLAAFNQVENTYLSIFLILGGLGLILGSVGIGIVVSRNIQERHGELSLLRAVGYSRQMVRKIINLEHVVLLLAGTVLGVSAAFVATYPTLISPGAEIPYLTIGLLLVLVLFNGALWIHLATALALRRPLLSALRNE